MENLEQHLLLTKYKDIERPISQYELQQRVGIDQKLMSRIIERAKKDPKRVFVLTVFVCANRHVAIPQQAGQRHGMQG